MLDKILDGIRSLVGRESKQELDFVEKRKLVRLRCHYDINFEMNNKNYKGAIMDMGMKGLKLRTSEVLKVGQKLRIFTPQPISDAPSDPVDCTVVWVRRPDKNFLTFAGIKYTSTPEVMKRSWVKYYLKVLGFKTEMFFSKRTQIRMECYIEGKIQLEVGQPFKNVKVCNLCIGGALVEFYDTIPLQQEVTLHIGPTKGLPQIQANAQIVKSRQSGSAYHYGVQFLNVRQGDMTNLRNFLKSSLQAVWAQS